MALIAVGPALLLNGTTLNMQGVMGLIMLIGIVVDIIRSEDPGAGMVAGQT